MDTQSPNTRQAVCLKMSPQQTVILNQEVTVKIPGAARTSYIRIWKWDPGMQSVLKAPQVITMLPRSRCHTLTSRLVSRGSGSLLPSLPSPCSYCPITCGPCRILWFLWMLSSVLFYRSIGQCSCYVRQSPRFSHTRRPRLSTHCCVLATRVPFPGPSHTHWH